MLMMSSLVNSDIAVLYLLVFLVTPGTGTCFYRFRSRAFSHSNVKVLDFLIWKGEL